MKCYYCGENEAEYRFFINYMGQGGEIRLCGECVEKLRQIAAPFLQEMQSHFQGGMPSPEELQNGINPEEWQQMPAFFQQMGIDPSAFFTGGPKQPERDLGDDSFPLDAGNEFRHRRRLNELRAQLSIAVTREDYETAASLRDEIGRLESGVGVTS